jgi:hypothetical protein
LLGVRVAPGAGDWRRGLLENQLKVVPQLVAKFPELCFTLEMEKFFFKM